MQKVHITDVILRDAHQSLIATRLRTEDMLPACAMLDDIGYWSLECWGGATFDACLRFLKEDPWERLHKLKAGFAAYPPANAAARTESARLPPLFRRCGAKIHRQSRRKRHGRVPDFRCAERCPQS